MSTSPRTFILEMYFFLPVPQEWGLGLHGLVLLFHWGDIGGGFGRLLAREGGNPLAEPECKSAARTTADPPTGDVQVLALWP